MVRIFPKSKNYIEELNKTITIKNKIDQHKVSELNNVRAKLIIKRDRLSMIRILLYIALYASVLSSLTSILNVYPIISEFVDFIFTHLGILGTTTSIVLIFLLTYTINNYDRDLIIIESHMLSLYVKYDKTKNEEFDLLMKKIK